MVGRGTSHNVQNDLLVQMVAALQQMNENLRTLNQNPAPSPSSQNLVPPGPAKYQGLDEFCKRNPSQFHEGFALDAALEWIQGMERIFRAMNCSEAKFLHKYFLADLKMKKEMEFLKLEQGNMSVGEYAAKFEELARFCPYSELEVDGRSKMYEDNLKAVELETHETNFPRDYGPQRNHRQGRGKERVEEDWKPYAAISDHRDHGFQRSGPLTVPTEGVSTPMCNKFCPKLDRRLNIIHAEEARGHGRVVTPSGAGTSGVDDPARGNCMVADIPFSVV
ncbi:hypothetical protein Lal_00042233 [Lupinus albus]|nr:hypothetical protein Lal_00042233 [Lupinus albus]